MIITLYLCTSGNGTFTISPEIVEEEESIKKTVRELVVPELECDPAPIEYRWIDGGRHMSVVLHKSGSKKNSVVAGLRKKLEKIRHRWVRLYNFDISLDDRVLFGNSVSMTVYDVFTKDQEEKTDGT